MTTVTTPLRSLGLFLGLTCLGTSLPMHACPAVSEAISQSPTPTSDRAQYNALDLSRLSGSDTATTPTELALAVFGASEPGEGNFSETIERMTESQERVVLLLTQMNLADDSVRGLRYLVEMVPAPTSDRQWQINWAGQQQTCWPGRGSQVWSTQSCS